MNEGLITCGHPSRGRYVMGCRCYMCRVANADYAAEQARRPKGSRKTAMVGRMSTARARKRVQGWLDSGVTKREICRATGIGRTAMRTLMTGEHPNAKRFSDGHPHASHRMSRKNYEAIMACGDPRSPKPGQLVDASSLNRALSWLYDHGVTPYRVAKESGIPIGTIYSLGAKGACEYRTLARLASAAERLRAAAEG